jgi:hypothetical protein
MQLETTVPVAANASAPRRHPAASLIAGGIAAFVAFVFLGAGTWALWVDRVDRDARGFLSIGTTELATETYAIESPLTGDGPDWLYGSTVFGTGRVRATSQSATPLFIGIARTSDLARYLGGTGHATIAHLASDELTPHPGAAQSVVPAQLSIWAASTQGVGEQTLLWKPRGGDWSIVLMNSDASPGVALRGSLAAKAPLLPWLAGALLLVGAALACTGGFLIRRGMRVRRPHAPSDIRQTEGTTSTQAPVGAPG